MPSKLPASGCLLPTSQQLALVGWAPTCDSSPMWVRDYALLEAMTALLVALFAATWFEAGPCRQIRLKDSEGIATFFMLMVHSISIACYVLQGWRDLLIDLLDPLFVPSSTAACHLLGKVMQ